MEQHVCGAVSTRRKFLGLVGAGAVTAVAGVGLASRANAANAAEAAGAAARRLSVPRTLAWAGGRGLVQPGFAVDYVGVRWSGAAGGGRVRFGDRSGRLGPWRRIVPGCGGAVGDGAPRVAGAALISAGHASTYELDLPAGASAVALNTTSGPPVAIARGSGDERTSLADGVYLSRTEWGADESLRFDENGVERYPQTYWPVQTLTVHHTATGNDDPDPAATVRAIYRFQTIDEDFGDIGYHFLIDEAGRVYEGRYSGDDGIPGFDTAGRMVNAAHIAGFNAGNVGIVLLGNFVDRAPTTEARRTLTFLLAAIAGWHQLDPLGTVHYVNPISGATKTVSAISGHRDWAPTLCPGGVLYSMLDGIRADVARLLGQGSDRRARLSA